MKKLLLLFLVIFSCNSIAISQNTEKAKVHKNSIHLDGGTLLIINSFTINFERHLFTSKSEKVNLYGSLGYGYANYGFLFGGKTHGVPIALTVVSGKTKHHFEMNTGVYIATETDVYFDSNNERHKEIHVFPYPILNLGYRYQKPGKNLFFRAKLGTLGLGGGIGVSF